jgi:hypothetical protein
MTTQYSSSIDVPAPFAMELLHNYDINLDILMAKRGFEWH